MSGLPGIVITGASGRMGQMLIDEVTASDKAKLIGVLEREGHEWVGKDLGEATGRGAIGVPVFDDPLEAFREAQAVIDFTSPDASVAHSKIAAQARLVHVIGTTGFAPEHLEAFETAARHATVIRAGNMSLGVNLLVQLTKRVAEALDEDFDIEVVEAGRRVSLDSVADRGRDGITGARETGHIGFSAIRGGDVVGEHDVIFAAPGERIVLRHLATDRRIFARGALKAALWGQGKGPGSFDMMDVLGLG